MKTTGRTLTAEELAIVIAALEQAALDHRNPDDRDDLIREYTVTLNLIDMLGIADEVTIS
ncbi:hypothetical protein [Raineyella sp.]|uniref:Uncharacterized protein n=1 Tax=bioreactor metagenome TaxID=1076179 RepID=A0A645AZA9_9ZZZZ|nr:hypothetical protein [Raineyella sp.]MEA5155586.1 hypothetical protein [Raineyella sp.]